MKTLNEATRKLLVMGMREEIEKDTYENPDVSVRWHKGMFHETNRLVQQYKLLQSDPEVGADVVRLSIDEMVGVLEKCADWWKIYFYVSPEAARQVMEIEMEAFSNFIDAERKANEFAVLEAFAAE